jgi:hypothetical protein
MDNLQFGSATVASISFFPLTELFELSEPVLPGQ